jgi:uracil-DNA glycosylase
MSDSNWEFVSRFIIQQFDYILDSLIKDVQSGNRFTPKIKDVFKAFQLCNHNELKVVFIGQDPYPHVFNNTTTADGLAFSCSHTDREQPSLRYIFDEIQNTVTSSYEHDEDGLYLRDCNLERWAKQGILLLNTALTTHVGKVGMHYEVWRSFITELITYIDNEFSNIVFVFMGNKAQAFNKSINKNTKSIKNHIINVTHPASAAYKNQRWNSKNMFNEINLHLNNAGKAEIIW